MQPPVSGATKILGLIADPVVQARSPAAVNALLAQRGRLGEFILIPLHVGSAGLADCVAALRHVRNFAGAIVSMPHKTAMTALVDELTDVARLVGAVNVIARSADGRLKGALLDGVGFVDGLLGAGHRVSGARCVVAGAGGAASAVAFALAGAGCASICFSNRTQSKALALAARVNRAFPAVRVTTDVRAGDRFDIAINGTSLGMNRDDELPLPVPVIERSALVAECVIAPEMTRLLDVARQSGCAIHTGMPMLTAQLPRMLAFMLEQTEVE